MPPKPTAPASSVRSTWAREGGELAADHCAAPSPGEAGHEGQDQGQR